MELWSPAGWAREEPGLDLAIILDPGQGGAEGNPVKAVELLVRLLGEDSRLGVVLVGSRDQVVLPGAPVTREYRDQILQALARGVSSVGRRSQSFKEKIDLALKALPSEKPRRRVLFFLAGPGDRQVQAGPQRPAADPNMVPEWLSGAKTAGITFYAAVGAQDPNLEACQNLAAATGGRVWKIQDNFPWHLAAVKLFQYLKSPQESRVKEGQFLLDVAVEEAVLVATRAVPGRSVLLTSPSGARLTPLSKAPTVRWWATPEFDVISISRPRPGLWRLEQARSETSQVFLHTGLTLSPGQVPQELAADEVLPLTMSLRGKKTDNFPPPPNKEISFGGEALVDGAAPKRTELRGLSLSPGAAGSLVTLEGEFPPLYQPGKGEIRVWVKGPDFQRQVVFPITVEAPWYSGVAAGAGKDGGPTAGFKPVPGRPAVVLEGTLRLRSPEGTMAGAFIRPASGAEIRLGAPPARPGMYVVEGDLEGSLPEGRPVVLALAPARLEVSPRQVPEPKSQDLPKVDQEAAGPINTKPSGFRSRKKWLWLGISVAGGLVLAAAVYLVLKERGGKSDEEDEGKERSEEDSLLRVKAQVEVLTKEKQELKQALEERDKQIKNLMTEKADLQKELARLQEKSQVSAKTLEELELKLKEVEKEAEAVQSEYMALYARSQANKEVLKKN